MSIIYLSPMAGDPLKKILQQQGYQLHFMHSIDTVAAPISCHPDIQLCKLGITDESPVFHGDPNMLRPDYPGDIRYNACCTGQYFIHNLKYTSPELLHACRLAISGTASAAASKFPLTGSAPSSDSMPGLTAVHVPQGYSRCSIVPVTETAIITYDHGIQKACLAAGLDVLLIRPGHILLPGYPEGFIGGTCGRIGTEILFNGDLSAHPDFQEIRSFIEERGISCVWSGSYPLTDIGSIIVATSRSSRPPFSTASQYPEMV